MIVHRGWQASPVTMQLIPTSSCQAMEFSERTGRKTCTSKKMRGRGSYSRVRAVRMSCRQFALNRLKAPKFTESVIRGVLVAVGKRRIIVDRIDECIDRPTSGHDLGAEVDQLGSNFADDVHTEQLLIHRSEQQLQ